MAERRRMVVSVDEIMEGLRDVAFEGKVLNRYGNYDFTKVIEFKYLHCDLVDSQGFTTVTVSVKDEEVRAHESKLRVGQIIRVENFGVAKKSAKSHEKGDLMFVLKVMSSTIVSLIEPIPHGFVPEFYHTDTVAEFRARSHEVWASATIAMCVIEVWGSFAGKYGGLYQVVVADGIKEGDYDILAFSDQFKLEYEQIVEAFNNGLCVMVLFKNFSTTLSGDKYLITRNHTIITPVVDESTRGVAKGV
ncbi:hypothetical protein M758_UG148100 [Ceratodon purpureus]|nr:hypothetical protein M758_UG148100 [Ceratodon purpureus]